MVYNQGTTFGLFAASSAFLVISAVKLALIGTLFVCCLYVSRFIHGGRLQLISRVSLLAVVGGSFGNLIDRLMDGQVTDFVDVGFLAFRWFVFNLADAFQVIGGMTVLSFILWQSLGRRQTEA